MGWFIISGCLRDTGKEEREKNMVQLILKWISCGSLKLDRDVEHVTKMYNKSEYKPNQPSH